MIRWVKHFVHTLSALTHIQKTHILLVNASTINGIVIMVVAVMKEMLLSNVVNLVVMIATVSY